MAAQFSINTQTSCSYPQPNKIKMNSTIQTRKTVSFNYNVTVAKTFASDDYNRESIEVTPLLPADIKDFHAYHQGMIISISVEQQMLRWKNQTDSFMADAFGGGVFCSSSSPQPSLASAMSDSDSEFGESSSQESSESYQTAYPYY